MADNTIDSLVLEINSNSKGAEKALDKLADSLQKVSNSLGGMNTAKFMYISKGIREMSSSLAGFSTNVKLADFNRVSNGLNKIAGIDAAGVRSTAVAMNGLMKSLNNMTFLNFDIKGITDVANGIAKLGRGTVTQAATNIPLLTESLKDLSNGLKGLKISFDIDGLAQLTASIQKLGSKSATKAAETNIIALGKALKEMMGILSKAPTVSQNVIQMTNSLAQLAAAGGRAGTASRSLMGSFNTFPSSTSKAKKGFSGLAGAIGKFYATYWLLIRAMGGFKKAIDISSDLTEVQNVVDVTFGEMADTMNEFADSALQNYGMSELMAKNIASRFQAMGVAMGFGQKKMTEMSIELTKLTGDMASFYNVTQESVAKALQSIFTGETEPMRRFGLDLSFATVEAWALSQGLEADMQKMTQAEKTMLRYQYVLANTGAASGDFLRTINSWHNQLVLLAGGFQQLGSIVGGVLINAFKPFIQALNSVMGAVINFAQVVSDALGAIFGWEYQTGGGVAQDLEDGFGAASGIEDAMGGAADNAKKLNKYIAGWHEVNNMTSDESKKGGSGGGGGAGGAGAADGGQWIQKESLWEKYTSSIDSLYELGSYISGVLTDAMNDIDWDSIYESARGFGSGLASFLNGLITLDLFGALGQTIAGSLNTVLHALDSFGETFDWKNFGNSIAAGINNFFATFDFALLANTINTWAQGILDSAIAAIEKIKWGEIGEKIGEFLADLDISKALKKVGKAIWEGINAGFEFYEGMFETAPLETALLTLVGVTKLLKSSNVTKFVKAISNGIDTTVNFGKALSGSQTALEAIQLTSPKVASAISVITKAFSKFRFGIENGNFLTGINEGLGTIRANLSGMDKLVIGAAASFGEFMMVKDSVKDLATGTGNVLVNLAELVGSAVLAGTALYTAFGPAGVAFAAVTGIVAAIMGIDDAMEVVAENSSIGQFSQAISDLSDQVSEKTASIRQSLSGMTENVETAGVAEANMARDLAAEYDKLSDKTSLSVAEKERLKQISQDLVGIIPELKGYIDDETGALDIQKGTLDAVITGYESLAQKQAAQEALVDAYKAQYEAQMNVKNAVDGYNTAFNEYLTNAGLAPDVIQQLADGQLDLNQAMIDFENSPKDFLQKYGVKDYGTLKKAVNGLNAEMDSYNTVLKDARETERLAAENVGYLNDKISEADKIHKASIETAKAEKMATDEYKQSLSDLSTEFDRLGVSISDSMTQELVLQDFDISSLQSFFGSIENGVQQSSDSLQQAFKNLGLSLPNDLAKALSQKEPDVQSETVKILMSIQSGLQANEGQLKTLFENLGIDLPDSIINNLAAKETPVQTATTNLLAKLESGYALKSGSLIEVFSGLGIEVPDSLIQSLENQEAPTQQAAIELLSQVQTASDEQRGPLLENLENLGIDASGMYNTGLASHNDEVKNTSETMVKNTKQPLNDEFSSSTSGAMYDYGANASKGFWQGVKDWWDDSFLKGAVDGVKRIVSGPSGLDEHSPSKVMELFGAYAIEGFNLGLEKEIPNTFSMIGDWVGNIRNLGDMEIEVPKLNTYIPKPDFAPSSQNLDKLKTTMQMEMDAKMAEYSYEIRQQNELLREQNELLRGIYEKPTLSDDDVFNATRRGQSKFQRRTFRTGWAGVD